MNTTGIYPGTFDPITLGHIDVVKRALKIVKKLVIAVSNDFSKDYLFSAEERVIIIKNAIYNDLKIANFSLLFDLSRKFKQKRGKLCCGSQQRQQYRF